jgi:hypothetical protein
MPAGVTMKVFLATAVSPVMGTKKAPTSCEMGAMTCCGTTG